MSVSYVVISNGGQYVLFPEGAGGVCEGKQQEWRTCETCLVQLVHCAKDLFDTWTEATDTAVAIFLQMNKICVALSLLMPRKIMIESLDEGE